MDKEVVVYIHNGILFSLKKEHIGVSSNEVDEPRTQKLIQNEVSQKEKDKYRILNKYRILKNGTEEFIYRAAMEKQMQRIDLWTRREGRRG